MAEGTDQLRKLAIVPAYNERAMVARVIRESGATLPTSTSS